MKQPDLTNAAWFKSSHSSAKGQCLEIAVLPGAVAARDSKDPEGPALVFTSDEWTRFIRDVADGRFCA